MKQATLLCVLVFLSGCASEGPARTERPPAAVEADIAVYFSPHGGAMAAILDSIDDARSSIDVQAYLMTAKQIVEALERAHDRGVKVRIIVDKKNIGGIYSFEAFLAKSGIPVWRDGHHKDAHDKIMLIDRQIIITGSFNFTDQSEETNGENLLVIRNKPTLFAAYAANFENHLKHSDPPVEAVHPSP